MTLDEIQDMWERDSQLDRTELGEESLRIPQLHSKYYKLFSTERLSLRKQESDYKAMYKEKMEYYNGTLDEETLRARKWDPNPLKILRSDLGVYMDADEDLRYASLKVEFQKEKVEFIEAIIKSLPTRGFQIKNAIDWERFRMGG
jgi:hypothetical protein